MPVPDGLFWNDDMPKAPDELIKFVPANGSQQTRRVDGVDGMLLDGLKSGGLELFDGLQILKSLHQRFGLSRPCVFEV